MAKKPKRGSIAIAAGRDSLVLEHEHVDLMHQLAKKGDARAVKDGRRPSEEQRIKDKLAEAMPKKKAKRGSIVIAAGRNSLDYGKPRAAHMGGQAGAAKPGGTACCALM